METKSRILMTIAIGVVLIAGFYLITNAITKYTGFFISQDTDPQRDFRSCLQEKDIMLYVNTANTAVTLKNIQLADYLPEIKITNCFRSTECSNNQIESFPTWVINGNKISKDITLDELKQFSGC